MRPANYLGSKRSGDLDLLAIIKQDIGDLVLRLSR